MIFCLDDNIFSDCAITAQADYLLTEDAHFAPLAEAGYKPLPLSPQQFIAQFITSGK
jgi:predicted nucleic acid-binding protein